MIVVKINVTKIDKARLFKGEKGTYLDLVMFEKKNAPGEYLIKQGVSQEERKQNIQMPIIGNGKTINAKSASRPATDGSPAGMDAESPY